MIEAAGGVVWRAAHGRLEVLLIHRPRYDDWSLPKGKLIGGEEPLAGAVREVAEETGFACAAGPVLPESRYVHRKGRDKRVRYWAMQIVGGRFRPNREVDVVRWVCIDDAPAMLSYAHDLPVLEGLVEALSISV